MKLQEARRDLYRRLAKEEGFKSRAAYKLIEANERYRIISRGSRVVDFGAAPGGWLQVCSRIVGDSGFVVGVDLREISLKGKNLRLLAGKPLIAHTIDTARDSQAFDRVILSTDDEAIAAADADDAGSGCNSTVQSPSWISDLLSAGRPPQPVALREQEGEGQEHPHVPGVELRADEAHQDELQEDTVAQQRHRRAGAPRWRVDPSPGRAAGPRGPRALYSMRSLSGDEALA